MNDFGVSHRAVLGYIRTYSQKYGAPPLLREIAARFGWKSKSTARCYVDLLIQEGKLTREFYSSRTISLVKNETINPLERLMQRADYWQSLGCIVVYLGAPPTGFKAYWSEPFGLAQEVTNVV